MSKLGRKSEFAQNLSNLNYEIFNKEKSNETAHCIVLDICGAHKPKSKFVEDVFETGIYFIVGCYETASIEIVYWNCSYDYLRMIYGLDSNIIGRHCVVECKSFSSNDMLNGNISFREGKRNKYQDKSNGIYMSISMSSGIKQNYERQIKNYEINEDEGLGEFWAKV